MTPNAMAVGIMKISGMKFDMSSQIATPATATTTASVMR